jgi:hypothetical protein
MISRVVGRNRRPDLPADARDLLGLGAKERVLAWGVLAGGGWAAALADRVVVLDPRGRLTGRPWTAVDHAAWDDESHTLAVWWVGSRTPTPLDIGDDTFLPEVVHERVRASVVLSREVEVPGGGRVLVALRKTPGGDLSTSVSPGRGVRVTDPDVAVRVRAAENALRDEAGLQPLRPEADAQG